MAVAMNVAVTAMLAGERWAVPHMPWPEVHPPATAAPYPAGLHRRTREGSSPTAGTHRAWRRSPDRISAPSRNTWVTSRPPTNRPTKYQIRQTTTSLRRRIVGGLDIGAAGTERLVGHDEETDNQQTEDRTTDEPRQPVRKDIEHVEVPFEGRGRVRPTALRGRRSRRRSRRADRDIGESGRDEAAGTDRRAVAAGAIDDGGLRGIERGQHAVELRQRARIAPSIIPPSASPGPRTSTS